MASWGAPTSILESLGGVRGTFGWLQTLIFQCFYVRALAVYKNSGSAKTTVFPMFSYVLNTSHMLRARRKTTQYRSWCLSKGAIHRDRAKNSSSGSPGSIREGSGAVLDASWASLGWLLAALGRLLTPSWAPLGHHLAGLRDLVGPFYVPRMLRASILEGLGACWAGFWKTLETCLRMRCANFREESAHMRDDCFVGWKSPK